MTYDIETIPLGDAALDLMEPVHEAPANLKDPAKIADAIAAKRAVWRERAALSPLTGRVAMVGVRAGGTSMVKRLTPQTWMEDAAMEEAMDRDEVMLIDQFWMVASMAFNSGNQLVSFNGHGFDLPFMVKRSWALGVSIPHELDVLRPHAPWRDLMKIFQCGDRAAPYVSLNTVARFFKVGQKDGDCLHLRDQLEYDPESAVRYLEQDLLLTEAIAVKMGIQKEGE